MASSLHAQLVNDAATNTLATFTTNITGTVTVGTNGSFTLLTLSDNALLTNSVHGVIGRNAAAKSNEVQLISPTARWLLGNDLYVGSNGAFNRLVISNGATVRHAGNGVLGFNVSSSNNAAWVTGPGSTWNSGFQLVGYPGGNNLLVVSNGGAMLDNYGYLGAGAASSSNNLAVVTGSGSIWSNTFELQVGGTGAGNQLWVTDGGAARSGSGYIGVNVAAASNNLALISGAGSSWSNTQDLVVGYLGANNNRLVVSNGATAFVVGNGIVGMLGGANANAVVLTDPGSQLLLGNDLRVGTNGSFNSLVISNGATASARIAELGFNTGAVSNSVVITGAGSRLTTSLNTMVGRNGAGNQLTISSGATVSSSQGVLGLNSGGSNNTALVTGSGSAWSNLLHFFVGEQSPGNRLVVSNGALVKNLDGFVGDTAGANNNVAEVTGVGSRWNNQDITVGSASSGNRLVVSSGGRVDNRDGYLSATAVSTGNEVTVTGAGSTWSNAFDLHLGYLGGGNRLVVTNGGLLDNRIAHVGYFSSGNGNEVVVTDPGSLWRTRFDVNVGFDGSGNRLVVSNGATVFANNSVVLGRTSLSSNNRIVTDGGTLLVANATGTGVLDLRRGTNRLNAGLIDADYLVMTNGPGKFEFLGGTLITRAASISNSAPFTVGDSGFTPAAWDVRAGPTRHLLANDLQVGGNSSFNQLFITNGAVLVDASGILAASAASSNNSALVTGPGSLWSNRLDLIVGWFGGGNHLLVTNGGRVFNASGGTVGSQVSSPNNQIIVSGNGSVWNSGNALSVGYAGGGNRLVVEAGGRVESNIGRIGYGGGSSNLALVTGAGSSWSNANLEIGGFGPNNQLIISNSATVTDVDGFLGHDPGASNNVVVVTGPGSLWNNSDGLLVGYRDRRNQLVVSNGATVVNNHGYIGYFNTADNNTVQVIGAGSVWSNRTDLSMGLAGEDNDLFVNQGGKVFVNGVMEMGAQTGADNNFVLVGGTGTSFSVSSNVYVGIEGEGNVMAVVGGASGSVGGETRIGLNTGGDNNYNELLVAGSGSGGARSTWTSQGGFYISGGHNYLRVEDGGVVRGFGTAYVGTGGPNNGVVVSAPGSLLEMTNDTVIVGVSDIDNQVEVKDGGRIRSLNATLGSTSSSSNSLVTVTGPGAVWQVGGSFTAGSIGPRNQLVISNQGAVLAPFVTVGAFASSTNNRVTVDGTLRATNILGAGQLDIRRGTNIFNAGVIETDRLVLTNTTQGFFEFNGGTLITRGISRSSTSQFMVESSTAPGIWDVRAGTGHALQSLLIVGFGSSSSQLRITNGGTLTNLSLQGVLGWDSSAKSNSATVSGPGSQWRLPTSDLYLGNAGSFSRLVVSNGGWVSDRNGYLAAVSGSSNNVAVITEAGSVWSNSVEVMIGNAGQGNQLIVSNGATAIAGGDGVIGLLTGGNANTATVTDPGSIWLVATNIIVGSNGVANRLTVGNGAFVQNNTGFLGYNPASTGNLAFVTGSGSTWRNSSGLLVGYQGSQSQLVVSNGGLVRDFTGRIGYFVSASNSTALVTGSGSLWHNQGTLTVGFDGARSRLDVNNNGQVIAETLDMGVADTSLNNRIVTDGGTLLVTNLTATGLLEIRRGTNVLNAGLIDADQLLLTNTLGKFEFNGGTLSVKNSHVQNGQTFRVGNGVTLATLILAANGAGSHTFLPPGGLSISANGALTGNGALSGALTVQPGGLLSPGLSIGTIAFSQLGSPSLQGTILMEISKNGFVLTNDVLSFTVTGAFSYGGSLIVTNLGPTALANGDRFQLFSAANYEGSFTSITLPPLPAPLSWTNLLLVDGSIQVVAPPALAISSGTYTQSFDSLSMSGSLNSWRDNSTLLGWYAAKSVAPNPVTNYIASDGGNFSGALYSFGLPGDGERALGSIVADSTGNFGYGLGFLNDLTVTVSNFFVTFTGEQWRSSVSPNVNTLAFWYRVSATPITDPEPGTTNNWTPVTALDFVSPTLLGTGVPLNGNQSTNRQFFGSVLIPGLGVAPGQYVFFRWRDLNDPGNDQGMALDDLAVSFSPAPADRFWTNALGGIYDLASNWLAQMPPGPEDTANFTNDASFQVTWVNDAFGASARFNAHSGIVTQFNQGAWRLTNSYVVGASPGATAAVIHVDGELQVENDDDSARLSIGEGGRGAFTFKSGLIAVSRLLATNGSASQFTFSGGELQTHDTIINNGDIFTVGDGVSQASLRLVGNGTHRFADGISVLPNATLEGHGTIQGSISMSGTLAPGPGQNQITVAGHLALFFTSTTILELNLDEDEHDSIVGIDQMRYGGTLMVTNLSGTLAAGHRFQLFSFTNFVDSAFDTLVLPPLPAGLAWENNLGVDGSIEVVTAAQPAFASVSRSGTNVIFSGTNGTPGANYAVLAATNVALPASNWTSIATRQFDASGAFSFTNATVPGIPQRFFRLEARP